MNLLTIAKYAAAITAVSGVIAGAWAGMDRLGVRPVVNGELQTVEEQIQVVGNSVAWLELENLERKLIRSGLTLQECARYRSLALRLGVQPRAC